MIISATGHRPNKLGGYGAAAYRRLYVRARDYLSGMRPDAVISGMALGWDQAFAEAAIDLGIPVHAAIPFIGQESHWPAESQQKYHDLLDRCKTRTIVSTGGYSAAKMQIRNEWMVDRSNRVCALWDGSAGGTGNCITYATGKKPIDNLWPL